MTAVRSNLGLPKWHDKDQNIINSYITYLQKFEKMCLDAGLIKVVSDTTMDVNNITLFSPTYISSNRNEFKWLDKSLTYDFIDKFTEDPVRLKFEFGYFSYYISGNTNNQFYAYNLIRCTITYKNKNYTSSGNIGWSSQNYYFSITNQNLDSFICVKDGYFSICIQPFYKEYQTSYANTSTKNKFFMAFERCVDNNYNYTTDNINLYIYDSGSDPNNNQSYMKQIIINNDGVLTYDVLSSYIDTGVLTVNGQVILYPIFLLDNNLYQYQSKNMFIVKQGLLFASLEFNVKVNNINSNFISIYNDTSTYVINGRNASQLVLRFE